MYVSYDGIEFKMCEQDVYEIIISLEFRIRERLQDKHFDQYPNSIDSSLGYPLGLLKTFTGTINQYYRYEQIIKEIELRKKKIGQAPAEG